MAHVSNMPKDYLMAEAAYNTFMENPQVPFYGLSHEYQMKWVHAVRAVIEVDSRYRRSPESIEKQKATLLSAKVDRLIENSTFHKPGKKFKGTEEQRRKWRIAKRISDEKKKEKSNGVSTT